MARRDSILVSRSLYQIGYITLVAAIVWVGVGVYTATNKTLVPEVDKSILEPITPGLDQDVIKALSNRLKIEIDLTVPPEEIETTKLATPSATIEDIAGAR